MRTFLNLLGFTVLAATSVAAGWAAVHFLGLESVRGALKFATAPAIFLGGFAATMLSKVHDLTEMQGIPIGVIDRLTPKVRVIHARLWALIGLITIATVLGWIIGSVEPACATAHIWVRVVAVICLALILLVTLVEALYLPMLHSDYSTFRMRIIRDYRDDVERENLLKRLLKE